MSNDVSLTQSVFKPKKSVALSGTPAGNTALCTVGRSGNDLHYRGYDINDLAALCAFGEVAHLLVQGRPPQATEGVDVTHLVGMKFEEAVDSHGCLWCDGDTLTSNHASCGKRRKPGHRWCPEHYARVYSGRTL